MKHSASKSPVTTRQAIPGIKVVNGLKQLTCPFCTPTHILYPDKPSPCGTIIQVTAVQVVIPARTTKKKGVVCLKCKKGGGEMIQYQNGFIHKEECDPTTKLMAEPPKFSPFAKIVFGLPEKLRAVVEKRTGAAKEVQEIDPEGVPTGKVLGHFFYKASE